jgi:ATP-dependent Clp protease adaptor protein ClpS
MIARPLLVLESVDSPQMNSVKLPLLATLVPQNASWDTGGDVKVLPETKSRDEVAAPWHVIIFNDPVNLMSYVTMVIKRIFGYSDGKATAMMLDVHQKGSCIVWTGEKEKAEFYVQQLQSHQLLCSMRKAQD